MASVKSSFQAELIISLSGIYRSVVLRTCCILESSGVLVRAPQRSRTRIYTINILTCVYIYSKELAHTIIEADKSQDL